MITNENKQRLQEQIELDKAFKSDNPYSMFFWFDKNRDNPRCAEMIEKKLLHELNLYFIENRNI